MYPHKPLYMFPKVFGLEKIKQMNLPYPPYAIIESEKVTPSKIKEIFKELQIPTIEGDRIGKLQALEEPVAEAIYT
jgi:hypothetical protein